MFVPFESPIAVPAVGKGDPKFDDVPPLLPPPLTVQSVPVVSIVG